MKCMTFRYTVQNPGACDSPAMGSVSIECKAQQSIALQEEKGGYLKLLGTSGGLGKSNRMGMVRKRHSIWETT